MIKRTTRTPAVKNTETPATEPTKQVTENTAEAKPVAQTPAQKAPAKRAPGTAAKAPAATIKSSAKTPVKPASNTTPKAVVKRTTTTPPKGSTVTPEIIEIETLSRNVSDKPQAILNLDEIAIEIVKLNQRIKRRKNNNLKRV
jgi:hypothetical protein